MRKMLSLLAVLVFSAVMVTGQTRTVTGQVKDAKGDPIPFATIKIKGNNTGIAADANGNFSINAPQNATLQVSAVGFETFEVKLGSSNIVSVSLQNSSSLSEVVVTALGIKRTRNQLPYAAQQISGEDVSKVRTSNVLNNLSGKISGMEIRQTNTMGGSVNVVVRGVKSMTRSSQALFVIDGVPFDNSNTNTTDQRTGRGGYDYGNAAADINPDDIESISVLKGAAASALYGSRGANGVVLITTKKAKKGLGITVNSGITVGKYDPKTFAKYQKQYGGGYGAYYLDQVGTDSNGDPIYYEDGPPSDALDVFFLNRDIDGDGKLDKVTPLSEDASYGAPFDPNLMVYQWDAFDPKSPYYHKARPWVGAANDPTKFFETSLSTNNSVFIDGASDRGAFKLGYTRTEDKGIMPNSRITKNLLNLGATYNITPKLTAGAMLNFSGITGKGRYGTGYNDRNMMTNFRQWWQVNTDVKEQKDAYFRERKNVTWNWADPSDLVPIYWDNVYFSRYENYENDARNRYFGNVNLNYKVNDWLNIMGRVSVDNYDELQEERQAIGSVSTPFYKRYNRSYNETNFDLLATFDKDITKDLAFKGLLGTNIRKNHVQTISASTNGGLIVERIYSLSNSANPIDAPVETDEVSEVDGVFAGATFTWKDMFTLDGTLRRDASSTLPKGNNAYYYPSVSAGFVFSQLIPTATWLSYGKVRANYAQVGSDAPVYSTLDYFKVIAPINGNPQTSVNDTKNNPNLRPERTKSSEIGLEMSFLKSRLGFDISYYSAKTFDQIYPVAVSTSTGYSSKYLNAGTIQNKGVELSAYGTPVKTGDFSWTINLNWTRNRNKVLSLFEGSENLLLANFQGGVSLNASLNEPYGTIRGSNFKYTNGQPTVGANGRYIISSTSNEVIANPNPDWIGGINNSLKYKNFSLSWLIDVRHGGQLFSLDLYYGLATGLYPETAGLNDLGKPSRNTIANGGGIILPGVTEDGKTNTIRVSNTNFGQYGYRYSPSARFVYDASFVKLREVLLTYSLPSNVMSKLAPFKGIDFSLIGRNLWLIHKNLPYADPEETISSGNLQGYQGGAYPTVRTLAFNVKLNF
jgi:TonB-linked SusC/RagA family outer membrane protein